MRRAEVTREDRGNEKNCLYDTSDSYSVVSGEQWMQNGSSKRWVKGDNASREGNSPTPVYLRQNLGSKSTFKDL